MTGFQLGVGIDIACETFQVEGQHPAAHQSQPLSLRQCPSDYDQLVQQLTGWATPQQSLVVMEATGTYWLSLGLYV